MSQILGLARSLLVYYAIPLRHRRMQRFYRRFIRPGDLCFDIGAHVGNRTGTWAGLGGRVIAVEPHSLCVRILSLLYGRHPGVTIVSMAVSSRAGKQRLLVCDNSPTLTTLSSAWIETVNRVRTFHGIRWRLGPLVTVTSLDELIRLHGVPVFCKIDIEGHELAALEGLSTALDTLSFEFLPASIEVALDCVARLGTLGRYRYNVSMVETMRFQWPDWRSEEHILTFLRSQPRTGRSGDVYARRTAAGQ